MRCSITGPSAKSDSNTFSVLTRDPTNSERGVALLELAVISTVFLFLFLCACDIAQMINRYVYLSQAAYEGARSASMTPGLVYPVSFDDIPHPNDLLECNKIMKEKVKEARFPCALVLAQFRARRTLDLYRPHIEQAQVSISAAFDYGSIVRVEAWMYYRGMIPLFRLIPISASFRMPYMALSAKHLGPFEEPK